jgi:CRISPR-associated protein Csd1
MSWMQALHETYERCAGVDWGSEAKDLLAPVHHKLERTHIEIVLDAAGNFIRAVPLYRIDSRTKGEEKIFFVETVIPVTPKSLTARTRGCAPYPLAEKLHYIAKDYVTFGGKKESYFKEYEAELRHWCESKYSHWKAQAVLAYVRRGCIIRDLLDTKVLFTSQSRRGAETFVTGWQPPDQLRSDWATKSKVEQAELEREWKKQNPEPVLLRLLRLLGKEGEPGDALVRWRVQVPGKADDTTWDDASLRASWITYQQSQAQPDGLCYIMGTPAVIAKTHPKGFYRLAPQAKLISKPNDNDMLTFQGRFTDEKGIQACSVGVEASQKIHSTLRWLIERQGYKNDSQVFVTWSVSGVDLPTPFVSAVLKPPKTWRCESTETRSSG